MDASAEPRSIDETDRRLIGLLRRLPRASVTDLSRELGVTRGTVQARLDRLRSSGTVTGFGPDLDPARAGFGVVAFTTLAIAQGSHESVVARLEKIPEVIEAFTVTGSGDMLCRIAARSNDHLHEVIQAMVASPDVVRTETQLALASPICRSLADLIADPDVAH